MSAELITLNVTSVNNMNVTTAIDQMFVPSKMFDVRANQNAASSVTITEAGDTQTVLSAWAADVSIGTLLYEGIVLYWTLTSASTVRTINLYKNPERSNMVATGYATIENGAAGTIYLSGVNDYTFSGSVLLTIGGGGITDDTDSGNTLTFTNITNERNLQLNGETEFLYIENREVKTKYTVSDTVAEIQAMIDGDSQ